MKKISAPSTDIAHLKKRYNIARKEMLRAKRTLKRATDRWQVAHCEYRAAQGKGVRHGS